MSDMFSGMFNFGDRLQMAALSMRHNRSMVVSSNIANAEVPGFRALGYSFEEQMQDVAQLNQPLSVKASNPKHLKNAFTQADGQIRPDVYVRPTESVGEDGNTVDMDEEMMRLARNNILFRATVESINRKVGMLRYAIQGGR